MSEIFLKILVSQNKCIKLVKIVIFDTINFIYLGVLKTLLLYNYTQTIIMKKLYYLELINFDGILLMNNNHEFFERLWIFTFNWTTLANRLMKFSPLINPYRYINWVFFFQQHFLARSRNRVNKTDWFLIAHMSN